MSQEKTYEIAPETVAGVAAGVAVGAAIKAVNEILCGQGSATVKIGEDELRELSDGIAKKVIALLADNKIDVTPQQAGVKETMQAATSGIMSELFDLPFAADRLNTRTRKVFDSIPPNSVGAILDLGAEGLRQYDGVGAKTAAEIFGIAAAQENEFSLPVEVEEDEELQSDLEEQDPVIAEAEPEIDEVEEVMPVTVFEDTTSDVEDDEEDEESMITEMEQSFENIVAQAELPAEEDEITEELEDIAMPEEDEGFDTFGVVAETERFEAVEPGGEIEKVEDVEPAEEIEEFEVVASAEEIKEFEDVEPVEEIEEFENVEPVEEIEEAEPSNIAEKTEEIAENIAFGIESIKEKPFHIIEGIKEAFGAEPQEKLIESESELDEEPAEVEEETEEFVFKAPMGVIVEEESELQGLVDIEDEEEADIQDLIDVEELDVQSPVDIEDDEELDFQGLLDVEDDEDLDVQESVEVEDDKFDVQDIIGVAINVDPEEQEAIEFEDDNLEGVTTELSQDREYIEIPTDVTVTVDENDDLAVAADVNMFVDDHLAAVDEIAEDVSSIAEDITGNIEKVTLSTNFDEAEFEEFLDNDPDAIEIEPEIVEAEEVTGEEVKSFTGAFMPQMSEEDIAHAVENVIERDDHSVDPVATTAAVTYDDFMETMVEVPDSVVAAEERLFAGLGHTAVSEPVVPPVSEPISIPAPVSVEEPIAVEEPVAVQQTISYDFDDFDDIGDLEDTDDDDFIEADVPSISNIFSGVRETVSKAEEKVEDVSESIEKTLDVEDTDDVIADLLAKMEARKLEFGKFVEQTRKNED